MINKWYRYNDIAILYLGENETNFIKYIAIHFFIGDKQYQIPFVPVHKDILNEFLDKAQYAGPGKPSPIDDSIRIWLNFNNQAKTFFTSKIETVAKLSLEAIGDRLSDFYCESEKLYHLPIIFPTNRNINERIHD